MVMTNMNVDEMRVQNETWAQQVSIKPIPSTTTHQIKCKLPFYKAHSHLMPPNVETQLDTAVLQK